MSVQRKEESQTAGRTVHTCLRQKPRQSAVLPPFRVQQDLRTLFKLHYEGYRAGGRPATLMKMPYACCPGLEDGGVGWRGFCFGSSTEQVSRSGVVTGCGVTLGGPSALASPKKASVPPSPIQHERPDAAASHRKPRGCVRACGCPQAVRSLRKVQMGQISSRETGCHSAVFQQVHVSTLVDDWALHVSRWLWKYEWEKKNQ